MKPGWNFDEFLQNSRSNDSLAIDTGAQSISFANFTELIASAVEVLKSADVHEFKIVSIDLDLFETLAFSWACIYLGVPSALYSQEVSLKDSLLVTRSQKPYSNSTVVLDGSLSKAANVELLTNPFEWKSDDLVRVVFSSGTTGIQKPIALSSSRLKLMLDAARANWLHDNGFMCALGISALSGLLTAMNQLQSGKTYVAVMETTLLHGALGRYQIETLKCSPFHVAELVKLLESGWPKPKHLKAVKVVGGFTPSHLVERLEQFGVAFENLYGSTEAGMATKRIGQGEPENIGRALPGVSIEIVDEAGAKVSYGETGILRYRQSYSATGYFDGDASAFQDGFFYPGDLAVMNEDGSIRLMGRSNEVVSLSGVKTSLIEIDNQVSEFEWIIAASSVPVTNNHGQQQILICYESIRSVDKDELSRALRSGYVGNRPFTLRRVDQLPRNESLKVVRNLLPETPESLI